MTIPCTLFFMVENFSINPYQYTWLNSFAKTKKIDKTFEVDYWGISNKNLQKKSNIKIAQQYTQASILIDQKKLKESELLILGIIEKDHKFYSPLALYLMIENNVETNASKIITYFDRILKNNSIDKENLNLIRIKKAIYLFDSENEKLITETLNPVINSNSVWKKIF